MASVTSVLSPVELGSTAFRQASIQSSVYYIGQPTILRKPPLFLTPLSPPLLANIIMSDPSPSAQPPPPGSQQQQPQTSTQEAPSSSSGTVVDQAESESANNIAPSSAQPDTIDPAGGAVDAQVDNDIDMNANAPENNTGANGTADAPGNPVAGAPTSKKESSLREFLGKMDEYAPIVRCDAFFPPPLGSRSLNPHLPCHYLDRM